jgi:hypothetical protein
MKFIILSNYKDKNLVAITTKSNKHLCNIYVKNLLKTFPNYVSNDETIVVEDLFQILDNACEIFETVETNLYSNVINHKDSYMEISYDGLKQLYNRYVFNDVVEKLSVNFDATWHSKKRFNRVVPNNTENLNK